MFNRWVLSRDRKTATEGVEVTRSGRLFQTRAAATGVSSKPDPGPIKSGQENLCLVLGLWNKSEYIIGLYIKLPPID